MVMKLDDSDRSRSLGEQYACNQELPFLADFIN